jgi:transposase
MSELTQHYRLLLGLDDAWRVNHVNLALEERKVEIEIAHDAGPLTARSAKPLVLKPTWPPEREWRHLDTMQFQTIIRARVPRSKCSQRGVKTIAVPWAGKHSRFTLLFEAFAVEVLQAAANVKRAAELLKLNWQTTHGIMQRAVERGLTRRSIEQLRHVGLDEKSFGQGHSYVSVITDLDAGRVLEVALDRTQQSADTLWNSLPAEQRQKVQAVSTDMWQPYLASTEEHTPQAEIVHDKFHVSKHLNEAVDQVRRRENKQLRAEGDDRLVGSKQLWLFSPDRLSKERKKQLQTLRQETLKTGRAWAIKEHFRRFWDYVYATSAADFFRDRHGWAVRSQLKPMADKAKMLKRHLDSLLSYFRHRITNAVSEGFNSRIKASSRLLAASATSTTTAPTFCSTAANSTSNRQPPATKFHEEPIYCSIT